MSGPSQRLDRWDVVIVGSGFGGSVSALRLAEKGYRVLVLEAGQRFTDDTLPRTSWDARKFLWAPALGLFGMQRITPLKHVLALSWAGVGGGSLGYANTLYEPLDDFYADPQWKHITDWRSELAPAYDQAKRMLGVVTNPQVTPADEAMRDVAELMGVGHTFKPTDVGVLFGEQPGQDVPDPFFGGVGPTRTTCTSCGACMTGCRVGAKNTMTKNYLHLAEAAGVRVMPMATVDAVRPLGDGGWAVDVHRTGNRRRRHTVTSTQVVLSAGTLGTQRLLQEMVLAGHLTNLSHRLGHLLRTNSEALLGAVSRTAAVDYSQGVAITSSFFPDERTHIEPVRYTKGANAMGLLATILVDGDRPGEPPRHRFLRFLREVARDPEGFLRSLWIYRWSERGIIALVMQSENNSLVVNGSKGLAGRARLRTSHGTGAPNPAWLPAGHDAVRLLADRIGGDPGGAWNDIFDASMTAHILGGAPVGDTPDTGVIDPYHRVFGHPGLHVVDGSAVSANLGVNPSLTITAMAERALSFWPNLGDADPRPPLGSDYRRLDPVSPVLPMVPEDAPGALRLVAS